MICVRPDRQFLRDMCQIADGGPVSSYTSLGGINYGRTARGRMELTDHWLHLGYRYEIRHPVAVVFHADVYYFVSPSSGTIYGLAPPFIKLPQELPPGLLGLLRSPA